MITTTRPLWHDDSYWAARDAARLRAPLLRAQAIDAFWSRAVAALRRRRTAHRASPPARVVLCD